MKRIYTRTGDKGTTSIHGRIRVPKTDIRIEANGTLDELNVWIGSIRTTLDKNHQWQPMLHKIQMTLMAAMSLVATQSDMRDSNPNKMDDNVISSLESEIDAINEQCTPPSYFILPGGTPVASLLHHARVVARRAERCLWHLIDIDPVEDSILRYINRLSDLFFIMARYELQHNGVDEEVWKEFGYKKRKPSAEHDGE